MRVFGLTTGADTAGINVAIAGAFRRHAPDWDVRSMVATVNYIGYPVDVPYSMSSLQRLYDEADVIHLHNTLHGHAWYDNGQGKPTVLHHHGLRNGSEKSFPEMVAAARRIGAVQVASTLDLAIREPQLTWVPAPVDLPRMRAIRRQHWRQSGRIRVGHAPTDRAIKGTDAFEDAMARIGRDLPVEKVLIEGQSWADCLRRKATVDLFFDQPVLGYGSNAIEAWAMGIPVIAGVADPVIRAGMLDRWGVLPFFQANEETLEDAIRELVADDQLRAQYSKIGTAHVERWHADSRTVEILKPLYRNAGPTMPGGGKKRWPIDRSKRIYARTKVPA